MCLFLGGGISTFSARPPDLDHQELLHVQSCIHHGLCLVWSSRETIQQATFLLHIVLQQAVLENKKRRRAARGTYSRWATNNMYVYIYIYIYINRYRYICDYILIYFVYMILDALGFMPRTLRMHKSTSPLNYTQLLHQIHNQLAWHQPQHSARPWADPESAISGGW